MARNSSETEKKLKLVAGHLEACTGCRSKIASDLSAIEQQITEIGKVLRNCREIAERTLNENCRKKEKASCQAPPDPCEDKEKKPCTKSSRVTIRWKK